MANICSFEMLIKGDESDIRDMLSALKGEGALIVGRGIETQSEREVPGGIEISGSCPWSIYAALSHYEGIERHIYGHRIPGRDVVSLTDACERFGVNLEIYAEEESCDHFDHYKYENGSVTEEYQEKPYKHWKYDLAAPSEGRER